MRKLILSTLCNCDDLRDSGELYEAEGERFRTMDICTDLLKKTMTAIVYLLILFISTESTI